MQKLKPDDAEVIDDLFGLQELSKFLLDEDDSDAKTYLKDDDFDMLHSIADSIIYEGSRGGQLLELIKSLEERHDELQLALKIAQSAVFEAMREFELTDIGSRAMVQQHDSSNVDEVIGNLLDRVTSVEAQNGVSPFDETILLAEYNRLVERELESQRFSSVQDPPPQLDAIQNAEALEKKVENCLSSNDEFEKEIFLICREYQSIASQEIFEGKEMLDHRLEKSTKVLEKVCKSFHVNVGDSDKKTWQSIDEPLVKIVKNIETISDKLKSDYDSEIQKLARRREIAKLNRNKVLASAPQLKKTTTKVPKKTAVLSALVGYNSSSAKAQLTTQRNGYEEFKQKLLVYENEFKDYDYHKQQRNDASK